MSNARLIRIGIDGDALRAPLSGVGHYVFNMSRELEVLLPDALFTAYSRHSAEQLRLPSARWRVRSESVQALRRLPSFFWLKTRGRGMCEADRLDAFWAGRTLHPGLKDVRTVCTVHDLNHLVVPQTMRLQARLSHRLWFKRDLAGADAVLAVSSGTAERLRSILGIEVQAIVPPGVAQKYQPPSGSSSELPAALKHSGVARPYLLSVATAEPRKNLVAVLRAYTNLKVRGMLKAYRLVMAGPTGWKSEVFEEALNGALAHGAVTTGYVPDELMPHLYASADALIFPSLYEGFGMPVLEARACGTKVVISNIPELREAGGPNAIVVEPTVEGIEHGMLTAIHSPAITERGLTEAHSWRYSGERLAAVMTNA